MAVMDASLVVEVLLRTPLGLDAFECEVLGGNGVHTPHLMDIEVMHTLRRSARLGLIAAHDAELAVKTLPRLQIERHAHLLLLPRIWELRDSVTAYDASYVALSEILGMPLLTCDSKLSRSHGHRAEIVLLS
jgi:predicted nucleic acid-binding protein